MRFSVYPRCSQDGALRNRITETAALANAAIAAYTSADHPLAIRLQRAAEQAIVAVMQAIAGGSEPQAERLQHVFTEAEEIVQLLPAWRCAAELREARERAAISGERSRRLRLESQRTRQESQQARRDADQRLKRAIERLVRA